MSSLENPGVGGLSDDIGGGLLPLLDNHSRAGELGPGGDADVRGSSVGMDGASALFVAGHGGGPRRIDCVGKARSEVKEAGRSVAAVPEEAEGKCQQQRTQRPQGDVTRPRRHDTRHAPDARNYLHFHIFGAVAVIP